MKRLTQILILLFAVGAAAPAWATPLVTMRETASVLGDTITLGDVAVVTGADEEQARRLSAVRLGRAPRLQDVEHRSVSREWVQACLAVSDLNRGHYILAGAAETRVRRVAEVSAALPQLEVSFDPEIPVLALPEPTLYDLLPAAQREALHAASGGYEYNMKSVHDAVRVALMAELGGDDEMMSVDPVGAPAPEVRTLLQGRAIITKVQILSSENEVRASRPDEVECYVELLGQPFADLTQVDRVVAKLTYRLTRFRRVLAAARPMQRGDTVKEEDLTWVRQPVSAHGDWQTDPAEIVGLQVLSPLATGRPIPPTALRRAPLVIKGGMITYRYANTATFERVTALTEGGLNDLITIELRRGDRTVKLQARVTGPNEARQITADDMPAAPKERK